VTSLADRPGSMDRLTSGSSENGPICLSIPSGRLNRPEYSCVHPKSRSFSCGGVIPRALASGPPGHHQGVLFQKPTNFGIVIPVRISSG
jgi:hypothetical protein